MLFLFLADEAVRRAVDEMGRLEPLDRPRAELAIFMIADLC